MLAARSRPGFAPLGAMSAAAFALLPSLLTSGAAAQFFADVYVAYEWHAVQLGQTISNTNSAVTCSYPWVSDRSGEDEPFLLDEMVNFNSGGCSGVVLTRGGNYSGLAAPNTASLYATSSIGAAADFTIDYHGRVFGAMTHHETVRLRVLTWMRGDLFVRFIADHARDNAVTWMDGRFRGPVDPLTGDGVLVDIAYVGSARLLENRPDTILAPGVYELNVEGSGEFLDVVLRTFLAKTLGAADVTAPEPVDPPLELDLDQDGWVGLSDGCLWANQPTDANQDGQTNQADLEFILALARAAGEDATDSDADGNPDQCTCVGDWNGDGLLNFFDIQGYLAAFAARLPAADLNGDGAYNFFDIQEFLNAFSGGC